ncbi:hypothetical protein EB118_15285, partial [bacterium]|nr:hypothetical protein [bacterium]
MATTTYKRVDGSTVTLPSNWDSLSREQQISWMNANRISEADLRANNFSQSDLDYLRSVGFTPYVAPTTTGPTTYKRVDGSTVTLPSNW